jgi:arylsulfatase A-like enzyme
VKTRNLRGLAALTLVALTAACSADEPGPGPSGMNVVLIVVDTLRRDHVSCYGYERKTTPRIDELAANGVRYETAYSQSSWTTPATASLLTSRLPNELGIRSTQAIVPEEAVLLGEMLEPYGYATGAVVSHKFCSERWNFDQGFASFDDSNALGHRAVTAPDVTDRAVDFLDRNAGGEQPFFLWVHYFDPHLVFVEHEGHTFSPPTDYKGPVRPGLELAELNKLKLNEEGRDELISHYDSEISFTDKHIGVLLDRLRALGEYDDTLVVLTSDHGESFREHGVLGHGSTLYNEVVNVPLIVKYPSEHKHPGGRTQPAALLDVVPTVLEVAGVPAPVPLQGHVLGRAPKRRTIPSYTHRNGGLRSLCDVRFKLIQRPVTGEEEMYNLARDPEERDNMLARGPIGLAGEVRERFLLEFDAWDRRHAPTPIGRIQLGPDELRELNGMGYASGE